MKMKIRLVRLKFLFAIALAGYFVITAQADPDLYAELVDAAESGNHQRVRELLTRDTIPNDPHSSRLPAIEAARNGQIEVLRVIGELHPKYLSQADNNGIDPMLGAVEKNQVATIRALVELGVNPSKPSFLERVPILHAARSGAIESANTLLDEFGRSYGITVEATDDFGRGIMWFATLSGDVRNLQHYHNRGGLFSETFDGLNLLHAAAQSDTPTAELFNYLLSKPELEGKIDFGSGPWNLKPMHFAIADGNISAIDILFGLECKKDWRGPSGENYIHYAVSKLAPIETIDHLARVHRIPADHQTHSGETPLHSIARRLSEYYNSEQNGIYDDDIPRDQIAFTLTEIALTLARLEPNLLSTTDKDGDTPLSIFNPRDDPGPVLWQFGRLLTELLLEGDFLRAPVTVESLDSISPYSDSPLVQCWESLIRGVNIPEYHRLPSLNPTNLFGARVGAGRDTEDVFILFRLGDDPNEYHLVREGEIYRFRIPDPSELIESEHENSFQIKIALPHPRHQNIHALLDLQEDGSTLEFQIINDFLSGSVGGHGTSINEVLGVAVTDGEETWSRVVSQIENALSSVPDSLVNQIFPELETDVGVPAYRNRFRGDFHENIVSIVFQAKSYERNSAYNNPKIYESFHTERDRAESLRIATSENTRENRINWLRRWYQQFPLHPNDAELNYSTTPNLRISIAKRFARRMYRRAVEQVLRRIQLGCAALAAKEEVLEEAMREIDLLLGR